MERSNHLHNFSLPTWGTRKLLSCSNDFNPIRAMPVVNYHESSDTEEDYIEEEISVTREKLLMEYRTDVDKMRERILKNKISDDEIPPINVSCTNEGFEERSKLKVTCNREVNESRSEKKSMRPRRNLLKKDERPKFSISLSRREIEEDLFAMTGKKPSRKPKKRPRSLQTKLDVSIRYLFRSPNLEILILIEFFRF